MFYMYVFFRVPNWPKICIIQLLEPPPPLHIFPGVQPTIKVVLVNNPPPTCLKIQLGGSCDFTVAEKIKELKES